MSEAAEQQRAVSELKGVGPVRSRLLADQGLHLAIDLLGLLPRRYRLVPPPAPLAGSGPGELVTVVGEIRSSRGIRSRRRGPGHLQVRLRDDDAAELLVEFFNQGFLRDRMQRGRRLLVSGRLREGKPPALTPIHHRLVPDGEEARDEQRILIEYPPVEGLKPGQVAGLVATALRTDLDELREPLPETLLERRGLPRLREAVAGCHDPSGVAELERCERRMLYNACLHSALLVESARDGREADGAPALPRDAEREARIRSAFTFEFTGAQRRAVEDIAVDLAGSRPMRRLVQGDVGSGKTAVALAAALSVALAGRQAAIMAPTEVLARQLHEEVAKLAGPLGIETALVAGKQRSARRREIAEGCARGRIGIAVGTQALFSRRLSYAALGLVVVDEQHRFGVMQRLKLVRKGSAPHLLAMSATPIPRSLALTIYSDLDLSVLDERPPGRQPIETRVHSVEGEGPYDWSRIADEAREARKAYVVFPAVESETAAIPSLLVDGRRIAGRFFRDVPVAALHGRMDEDEKRRNLEAFRKGDVKVLFATTVIEVGVDVPDAERIVVVGAGRFGLAQLHQLRGRVGRGGRRGFCDLVVASRKAAESERLRLLEETEDGFRIAELDLELRGPGDMMGLRQHGVLPVALGADDEGLFLDAFEDARELVAEGRDVEAIVSGIARFRRDARRRSRQFMEAG